MKAWVGWETEGRGVEAWAERCQGAALARNRPPSRRSTLVGPLMSTLPTCPVCAWQPRPLEPLTPNTLTRRTAPLPLRSIHANPRTLTACALPKPQPMQARPLEQYPEIEDDMSRYMLETGILDGLDVSPRPPRHAAEVHRELAPAICAPGAVLRTPDGSFASRCVSCLLLGGQRRGRGRAAGIWTRHSCALAAWGQTFLNPRRITPPNRHPNRRTANRRPARRRVYNRTVKYRQLPKGSAAERAAAQAAADHAAKTAARLTAQSADAFYYSSMYADLPAAKKARAASDSEETHDVDGDSDGDLGAMDSSDEEYGVRRRRRRNGGAGGARRGGAGGAGGQGQQRGASASGAEEEAAGGRAGSGEEEELARGVMRLGSGGKAVVAVGVPGAGVGAPALPTVGLV